MGTFEDYLKSKQGHWTPRDYAAMSAKWAKEAYEAGRLLTRALDLLEGHEWHNDIWRDMNASAEIRYCPWCKGGQLYPTDPVEHRADCPWLSLMEEAGRR